VRHLAGLRCTQPRSSFWMIWALRPWINCHFFESPERGEDSMAGLEGLLGASGEVVDQWNSWSKQSRRATNGDATSGRARRN